MAATADRILAEARGEFARRGFAAARLQDIAGRAGLSHPTLLYHFGSKERLYEAVIEQAVHDWADTTRRAISTGLRGFDQVAALLAAGFEQAAQTAKENCPVSQALAGVPEITLEAKLG